MKGTVLLNARKQFGVLEKQVITREFPLKTKIHVAVNDSITPETVIADYETSSGFHLLHLGQAFGRGEQLKEYLRKREGDKIYAGEIIAQKSAFLPFHKHTLHSPIDGTIQSITVDGDVTIKLHGNRVSQASLFWGKVVAIEDQQRPIQNDLSTKTEAVQTLHSPKVSIETQYINLYGVMGSGRKREGRINVICPATDFMLPSNLDQTMEDCIIICGALIERGMLERALRLKVSGMIAGGIHLRDATAMGMKISQGQAAGTDVGISILATEGFGPIGINDNFYTLITKFTNRYGMLDGNSGILTIPVRTDELPELAAYKKSFDEPMVNAKVNMIVRIVDGEYIGKVGKITDIASQATMLPSGFTATMVSIELANLRKEAITIPAASLEIIMEPSVSGT